LLHTRFQQNPHKDSKSKRRGASARITIIIRDAGAKPTNRKVSKQLTQNRNRVNKASSAPAPPGAPWMSTMCSANSCSHVDAATLAPSCPPIAGLSAGVSGGVGEQLWEPVLGEHGVDAPLSVGFEALGSLFQEKEESGSTLRPGGGMIEDVDNAGSPRHGFGEPEGWSASFKGSVVADGASWGSTASSIGSRFATLRKSSGPCANLHSEAGRSQLPSRYPEHNRVFVKFGLTLISSSV